MPAITTRNVDTTVLSALADPQTGLTASEVLTPMPSPLNNIVTDTGLVELPASRVKTLVIVVTAALSWVTSGQPTVQLFAARTRYGTLGSSTGTTPDGSIGITLPTAPFIGSEGAASGFPTGNVPNTCTLVGNPSNLGPAAATTLAAGNYWFTPSSTAELQWWYPVLGIEIKFPSALTGGSFFVALEVAPL